MSVEKKLKGKFKPRQSGTAKDFVLYLIGNGLSFSYSESSKDGSVTILISFEYDAQFDDAKHAFDSMEEKNNPQMSIFDEEN
ncbi:hypothetical protein [Lactococcus lactis]|uniref:hypothetical protein n=1 Tax=Lactococcus lactis TaxID=1358 RepID=UPI001F594D78|nr:hypothetical protein [Lactococcus lactis]